MSEKPEMRNDTDDAQPGGHGRHGDESRSNDGRDEGDAHGRLAVAISTSSGFFPDHGFATVPLDQRVQVQLDAAKTALGITDTSNWVAVVKKDPIDANRTYRENGLKGEVTISWGPSEGGGGI